MDNWTPTEWAAILVAGGTFLNTALIALATFIANLAKIRGDINAQKIDHNTKLTEAGATAAVANAKAAAVTASKVAEKTEELSHKLNGGLDAKIRCIVKEHIEPLSKSLDEHGEQDELNMLEIRNAIVDLKNSLKSPMGAPYRPNSGPKPA